MRVKKMGFIQSFFFVVTLFLVGCQTAKKSRIPAGSQSFNVEAFSNCVLSRSTHTVDGYRKLRIHMDQRDSEVFKNSDTFIEMRKLDRVSRMIVKEDFLSTVSFIDDNAYSQFLENNPHPDPFWYKSRTFYSQTEGNRKLNRKMFVEWLEKNKNGAISASQLMEISSRDPFHKPSMQAAIMSGPLVEWLGRQPSSSVSHWGLLDKALSLYGGDLFVSIGIINYIFRKESTGDFKNRPRKFAAYLDSRMHPILSDDLSDRAGHNYHFWSYLAASLKKGGTKLANFYSSFLERDDPGDRKADQLAIAVADRIIAGIGSSPLPVCSLGEPSEVEEEGLGMEPSAD